MRGESESRTRNPLGIMRAWVSTRVKNEPSGRGVHRWKLSRVGERHEGEGRKISFNYIPIDSVRGWWLEGVAPPTDRSRGVGQPLLRCFRTEGSIPPERKWLSANLVSAAKPESAPGCVALDGVDCLRT